MSIYGICNNLCGTYMYTAVYLQDTYTNCMCPGLIQLCPGHNYTAIALRGQIYFKGT